MAPTLTILGENLVVLRKDGDLVYKGEWHDRKRSGLGTSYSRETDSYGDILYTGHWKDNKYDGLGTLYDSEDTTQVLYKGEFKKHEYDGMGRLFENGEIKYQGEFKNGKYHGTGVLHENDVYMGATGQRAGKNNWVDGGDERYEGNFCMGERHGFGVQYAYDPDHDIDIKVYEGRREKDHFSGYGTAFFIDDPDNQVQFEGMWKQSELVLGKEWVLDSDMDDYTVVNVPYLVYDGAFHKGKRHGEGTEYAKDGTVVFSGEWVDGKRKEEEERSPKRVRVE